MDMAQQSAKPTILIVEDEPGPRDALRMILRPFFNLIAVDRAGRAMQALREQHVDLVTLDLKLPDQQGVDLLQDIKLEYPDVEAIIITGYGSLKSAMEGIRYGASGYLLKPFNVTELIAVINQTLTKRRRLTLLREFLRDPATVWSSEPDADQAWRRVAELYTGHTLTGPLTSLTDTPEWTPLLFELLEAKSRTLFNHSSRVSFYSGLMGKALALSEEDQKMLCFGSFLHDIGRLAIEDTDDDAVMQDDPRGEARRHPEAGARMVMPLRFPAEIGQIISYHHERHDGSGYPFGLEGDGIPLFARIVHLTEAFDHLLTDPTPVSMPEALDYIVTQAGTSFDPVLTEVLLKVMRESDAVMPPMMPTFRPATLSRR